MRYAFMPNYFTLDDIVENCLLSRRGDCGVLALTFITLCRCAGISARWESGLAAEPEDAGPHDWAKFYVAPYGWLYADVSYGVSAHRVHAEERRQFYFGNLDPWRMVANNAFLAPLTPPMEGWRADPYDNQTGEMESNGRGFRYDEMEQTQTILLHEPIPTI